MKDWLKNILLVCAATLAPIQAILISVFILILADFFTGMFAAKKRKESITSAAMRRTVSKFVVYNVAIISGFLLEQYLLLSLLPVSKLVAGVIGLVEFKSILENSNTILGENLFQTVLVKLGSENDKKSINKKD